MILRPVQAFVLLTLIAVLLVTACQTRQDPADLASQLTQTAQVTAPTATPAKNTPSPTRTPTIVPSPTLPAYLQVAPDDIQGTAIQFWHPWQGDMAAVAKALAGEFSGTNQWGISVQAVPYYNDSALQAAVNQAFAESSEGMPVVIAAPADELSAWSQEGDTVVDLDAYLRHPAYGFTQKEIAAFVPVFWNQDQLENRQLGIPALRSGQVLFYNQSWARELGFEKPPANAAEFKRQACAAAVANNTARSSNKMGTGGWLVSTNALTAYSWLEAFDAQILPQKPGLPYAFQSEGAQAGLTFLRGLMDDGCAWTGRGTDPHEYFATRMALFYSGTLSDLFVQKNYNAVINNLDEWTILPFPGKDGQQRVYASGPSYAALRSSPETQMAAWLFIRWMAQPRNLARLAELQPSFPVSSGVEAQVADYRLNFPWDLVFPLKDKVVAAPSQPSWRVVRRLLEDAAWQVFYLPAEQVVYILPQLEALAEELLTAEP